MELVPTLQCACRPGFTYKSSLSQHKKTKLHLSWEALREVKDVRTQSKAYENELERMKRRLGHKEAIEAELLVRIRHIEEERDYWKKHCEGVYIN
jgi:hypothetical protein